MVEDLGNMYSTISEFKEDVDSVAVARKFGKYEFLDKIISFIYSTLIKFVETDQVKGMPMSKIFVDNSKGIMRNKTHIHHLLVSGKIIGYAHSYCNYRVRENKPKLSIIAHNLFRFDFFFLLKGLRAGVWKTRDITIGGTNPTNINFTIIGNQVIFIDPVKYFQQGLQTLASNLMKNVLLDKNVENLLKRIKTYWGNLVLAQKRTKGWY